MAGEDDAQPASGELLGLAARATDPIYYFACSRYSVDSSRLFRSDNANELAEELAMAIVEPCLMSLKILVAEASSWLTEDRQSSPWLSKREIS